MRPRVLASAAVLLAAGCGITGNFLARFVLDEDDEAELGGILEGLRAVRVYSYEVHKNADGVARRVREAQSDLLRDGWLPLAAVRDGAESVAVLLRVDRNRTRGLAVIVHDPQEVVLVNLIGDIRLELFGEYMAELDIGSPPIEIDPAALQAAR
jgi:hypothetical protein